MAGGKGKSSGGKSSGGKVGADGGKKQQSHSSKAGLQVSFCANLLFCTTEVFLDEFEMAGGLDGFGMSATAHPAMSRYHHQQQQNSSENPISSSATDAQHAQTPCDPSNPAIP